MTAHNDECRGVDQAARVLWRARTPSIAPKHANAALTQRSHTSRHNNLWHRHNTNPAYE